MISGKDLSNWQLLNRIANMTFSIGLTARGFMYALGIGVEPSFDMMVLFFGASTAVALYAGHIGTKHG